MSRTPLEGVMCVPDSSPASSTCLFSTAAAGTETTKTNDQQNDEDDGADQNADEHPGTVEINGQDRVKN